MHSQSNKTATNMLKNTILELRLHPAKHAIGLKLTDYSLSICLTYSSLNYSCHKEQNVLRSQQHGLLFTF